jgi:glycosyltransferase involved in cell wall biosynthesis
VHLHYRVRDNPLRGPRPTGELRHRVELALAERRAIASFPWLIANSADVASTLRRTHTRVTVAALSIDVSPGLRAGLDGPPRLGIIGTASWPPTRAALRRLVERIWPAIRRRVPRAELHVAGRGTAGLLQGLRAPGIVLAGEVPSATGFLSGLSTLIYPVPRGGGMKVKVLESLAIGLPVITTAAGAEGIAPGDGVRVAADDAGIVDLAVALLSNEALRHACGAAAHRTFAECFTPERATEPLVRLYRSMLTDVQDFRVESLVAARDGRP